MAKEELLSTIDGIKEYIFEIIENVYFNNKETFWFSIARIKEVAELVKRLDELEKNIDDYDNLFKIVVSNDTVIYPEETIEIKTNVYGYHFDDEFDVVLSGFIPKSNNLELSVDEEKMRIYIENRSLAEETNNQIIYSNPLSIYNKKQGIYILEKGTIIGFVVKRKNYLEKSNFVRDRLREV